MSKLFKKFFTKLSNESLVRDIQNQVSLARSDLLDQSRFAKFDHMTVSDFRSLPVRKNAFLLFNYPNAFDPRVKRVNLGDYIQTIAVESALQQYGEDLDIEFFDRDNIINYYPPNDQICESRIVVMQGFFWGGAGSFPNKFLYPVYIGTHLGGFMEYGNGLNYAERSYLKFIRKFPRCMENQVIGCRDKRTMKFFQTCGIDAYFSRCLSLTLPSLTHSNESEGKILVAVRKYMEPLIPKTILQDCEMFNPDVDISDMLWNGLVDIKRSAGLIDKARWALSYYSKAKLVVTDRVHIIAPCLAMGIPVVAIKFKESDPRYDMFDGLIKTYTVEELRSGKIDFNPAPICIEPLKKLMLENFNMTMDLVNEKSSPNKHLAELRKDIANYRV